MLCAMLTVNLKQIGWNICEKKKNVFSRWLLESRDKELTGIKCSIKNESIDGIVKKKYIM